MLSRLPHSGLLPSLSFHGLSLGCLEERVCRTRRDSLCSMRITSRTASRTFTQFVTRTGWDVSPTSSWLIWESSKSLLGSKSPISLSVYRFAWISFCLKTTLSSSHICSGRITDSIPRLVHGPSLPPYSSNRPSLKQRRNWTGICGCTHMIFRKWFIRWVFDRFCDAMIQIRKEVEDIASGKQPKDNNLLKNAPHPISVISLSEKNWNRWVGHSRLQRSLGLKISLRPYDRDTAAYPLPYLRTRKFWPSVSRIEDGEIKYFQMDEGSISTARIYFLSVRRSQPHCEWSTPSLGPRLKLS